MNEVTKVFEFYLKNCSYKWKVHSNLITMSVTKFCEIFFNYVNNEWSLETTDFLFQLWLAAMIKNQTCFLGQSDSPINVKLTLFHAI